MMPTSKVSEALPAPRALVVDDEQSVRMILHAFLSDAGCQVDLAGTGAEALNLLTQNEYDLAVVDIVLPDTSGVELLKSIRSQTPDIQVLMLTGHPAVETAAEAVRAGATDYLIKPVSRDDVLRAVQNALRVKRLIDENRRLAIVNRNHLVQLERTVAQRTRELEQALSGAIQAMSLAIESRDPYTAGHQQRVAHLGRAMACQMGLKAEQVDAVFFAGQLHDLGKLSVPTELLCSPVKLCDEAMGLIRKHPRTAYDILKHVAFPWPIAEIVLQHHERMDGSGYPQGLAGDAIRMEARILAVADVVEAMSSHRPYRPALGIEAALREIDEQQGQLYDPAVADVCLRLFLKDGYRLKEDVVTRGSS